MLNEIVKGMDNAGEKINENFEQLDPIQETFENGSCTIYPDGTKVCHFKREFLVNSQTNFYTLPTNFEEIYFVDLNLAGATETDLKYDEMRDLHKVRTDFRWNSQTNSYQIVMRDTENRGYSSTTNFETIIIIVGR